MKSCDWHRHDGGVRARRGAWLVIVACAMLGLAGCNAHIPSSTAMRGTTNTAQPTAYADLCARHPQICKVPDAAMQPTAIRLDEAFFEQLSEVNSDTNRSIRYRSDREAFGLREYWEIADTAGDCEDFALRKLARLLELGVPRRALHMAIARRPDGILHAVLAVETDRGTYVLDSSHDRVRPWDDLGYTQWRWEEPGQWAWRTVTGRGAARMTSGES